MSLKLVVVNLPYYYTRRERLEKLRENNYDIDYVMQIVDIICAKPENSIYESGLQSDYIRKQILGEANFFFFLHKINDRENEIVGISCVDIPQNNQVGIKNSYVSEGYVGIRHIAYRKGFCVTNKKGKLFNIMIERYLAREEKIDTIYLTPLTSDLITYWKKQGYVNNDHITPEGHYIDLFYWLPREQLVKYFKRSSLFPRTTPKRSLDKLYPSFKRRNTRS